MRGTVRMFSRLAILMSLEAYGVVSAELAGKGEKGDETGYIEVYCCSSLHTQASSWV